MSAPITAIPPIFDEDIVRTNSYSEAMSKANRGKTLDEVKAAEDDAKTFTLVLKKPKGGTFGVAIGSTQDETQHVVHSIKNLAMARKSGAISLMVNDLITRIGTTSLQDASVMDHVTMTKFMQDNDVILMEIQRTHPDYTNVELARGGPEGKLGITVSTVAPEMILMVNSVFGPAVGKLEFGDRLIACNGRLLRSMAHAEAEAFLGAHNHITLTVERSPAIKEAANLRVQQIKSNTALANEMSALDNLVITRPSLESGWGLHLGETMDGRQVVAGHSHPGILMDGDIITSVNGHGVDDMSHEQMVHQIMSSTRVVLSVLRSIGRIIDPDNLFNVADVADEDVVTAATVNILRDTVEQPMGFVFGTRPYGGHVVREVTAGMPAHRAGLEPYDVILQVNGVEVGDKTHEEVLDLLKQTANVEIVYDRGAETAEQHSNLHNLTTGLGTPGEGEVDVVVVLVRDNTSVPIGCGLGTNADGRVFFTEVVDGTLASVAGIQSMDELIAVDGNEVLSKPHDDVVAMINSSTKIELQIRRREQEGGELRWQRPELSDERETVKVTLERSSPESSFGFGLGHTNSGRHYITGKTKSVDEDDVRVLDEVIEVNGESVQDLPHADVVAKIFGSGLKLELTVLRDPAAFDNQEPQADATVDADGQDHFEVTIQRPNTESSFGFGLGTTPQLTKVITNMTEELEAKHLLRVADVIEEINGVDVTDMDHLATVDLVRQSGTSITFKVSRTVVEMEGRDMKRKGSIRVVDPALAAKVEDSRTDSVA
eukprot:m.170520 g.170520  ORF g.170520 m.170520 type:complete len:771 (+) comp13253_c0_seq1:87-2399(+)